MSLDEAVAFFDIGDTLATVTISIGGDRIASLSVFPNAPAVLTELRKLGVRLGIISNRGPIPADEVDRALRQAGLWDFFESDLVVYGPKNSPRIFTLAAARAGAPDLVLFVGENAAERGQAVLAGFQVAATPELARATLEAAVGPSSTPPDRPTETSTDPKNGARKMHKFHYHVAEDTQLGSGATSRSAESFDNEGLESLGADAPSPVSFNSNEAAARYYLDELLQSDGGRELESVTEPERPERVPGLVVQSESDLPALGTHLVRFTQTQRAIPVFGASAVVELTRERDLVSVSAQLHDVPDVSPVEALSRADALARVAEYTGVDIPAEAGVGGRLNYYRDEETGSDPGSWHLVWLFDALPAEPPASPRSPAGEVDAEALEGHGMGPRPTPPRYTYLVDANSGQILFCYSAVPTIAIPARCTGIDENETRQMFFGQIASVNGTTTQLIDPLRAVKTYDLQFVDIDTNPPVPNTPVQAPTSDFKTTNRAAVSAHLNAARVQDFYKTVLQRNGIDDQGMDLISLVNVTFAKQEPPPALLNAFWFDRRMWYGQINRNGRLVSLSRYLDVIGHELTHGVIETTSGLVYATQSGALNESFADIAGVIINNWYTAPDRTDVGTWTWEIGPGLRSNGGPLRNFADPALTGHPKHMNAFRALAPGELPSRANDNGWVHFNSNIHNKAVHNLLTANAAGQQVFSVEDVAVLTYLGMARLAPRATFSDTLQSVVDVAQTFFGGDPDKAAKITAIRNAYGLVGIT